jgi:hypothetical protein
MRVVKRQDQTKPDESYIKRLVEEFKNEKAFVEEREKRLTSLKKELSEYVDSNGIADHNGHLWVKIDDIEIKRERRVSRSFNSAKAREWAEENGFWDQVSETIVTLSEDKMLALAWENKDLAPIIQAFYEEKESWAFKA